MIALKPVDETNQHTDIKGVKNVNWNSFFPAFKAPVSHFGGFHFDSQFWIPIPAFCQWKSYTAEVITQAAVFLLPQ